jgi:hypothetical protein
VLHTECLCGGFFKSDHGGVGTTGDDVLAAAQKREHGPFNFRLKCFVLALKVKKRNHKQKCELQIAIAD